VPKDEQVHPCNGLRAKIGRTLDGIHLGCADPIQNGLGLELNNPGMHFNMVYLPILYGISSKFTCGFKQRPHIFSRDIGLQMIGGCENISAAAPQAGKYEVSFRAMTSWRVPGMA